MSRILPSAPTVRPSQSRRAAVTNHSRVLTKLRYALFGVLSALAGMAAGHLVAAVTRPESSPVLAVGETVIDHTPTPVKNWAIAHFGTHDKTILVGSVLIGVLLLAGVAGVLAHRAFRYGAALLVVLVGVALYAALSRPVVHPVDALPGARHRDRRAWRHCGGWSTSTTPGDGEEGATSSAAPSRRAVLLGMGGVAVVAAASGYAGRLIAHSRAAIGNITLPRPQEPGRGVPRRPGPQGPRHHAVPDPGGRLLPRGHPALPADRRRRLLGAA